MHLQDSYPIVVTEHLSSCRDFYRRWCGREEHQRVVVGLAIVGRIEGRHLDLVAHPAHQRRASVDRWCPRARRIVRAMAQHLRYAPRRAARRLRTLVRTARGGMPRMTQGLYAGNRHVPMTTARHVACGDVASLASRKTIRRMPVSMRCSVDVA